MWWELSNLTFLTREAKAFACTNEIDSEEFLNILTFGILLSGRFPRVLYSDRGSNLISSLCQEYYKVMEIRNVPSDSHTHSLPAVCERFNATLRDLSRAGWFDHRCQWDLLLPFALSIYNSEIHPATGYSPFYLNHGRPAPYPWMGSDWAGWDAKVVENASEYVQRQLTSLHAAWDAAQRSLKAVEGGRAAQHNKRYLTTVKLEVGQRVLVRRPPPFHKLELPWRGPFRVSELLGMDRYRLTNGQGFRFHDIFHISRLNP